MSANNYDAAAYYDDRSADNYDAAAYYDDRSAYYDDRSADNYDRSADYDDRSADYDDRSADYDHRSAIYHHRALGQRSVRTCSVGCHEAEVHLDGPAQLAQDLLYTGVTYNCIETFSDADPAWSDWVDPWIARSSARSLRGWRLTPTGAS